MAISIHSNHHYQKIQQINQSRREVSANLLIHHHPNAPSIFILALSSMEASHLLFLFTTLLISSSLITPTSSQSEQQILLQIKRDFGDPPYLSSWNSSSPHCNWTGIKCTSGSVTSISLSNGNIQKPIPDSICKLRNLSVLDLSYNYIPGSFPTSLYDCTNLLWLDISQNLFVGRLPSSLNRISKQIYYLSLSANNFTGDVPPSLGQLSKLEYLLLDNNLFDGTFPADLGNLSNLECLWMANNSFAPMKIPDQFGNMTSLSYLWMTATNLYGEIPDSFVKLTNLVHLDLAMNSLSGRIPTGIWMLEKLEKIYLWHNRLTGEIDTTIGAKSLVEIDVSMNNLTGLIPSGFGKLRNLTHLFLYRNKLSGEIPIELGLLPWLTDLRLFENNLTGILPPELGKHSNLWNLEVNDNALSGELPQFICARGNFTSLVVFDNNFAGDLPPSLCNCPTLNNLMVQKNHFSGEVPTSLWSTALNLTTVIMHHNSFSGTLPEKLPWNLTRLEIQFNKFSGNIPSSAQNLVVFGANNNLFSGVFPSNLDKFSSLQILSLGGNRISGEIPSSISSLKFLTLLNLSSNRLSGNIPSTIGSLPVLTTIDLSENQLSGSIPSEIGNLKLNFLNLSSNDLAGEIPVSLQVFDEGFLSNPNLCSSNHLPNLRSCARKATDLNNLSTGLLVAIVVLSAIVFLAAVALGLFMLRERRRRKLVDDTLSWKVKSFILKEFNESNILKGLTNENLIGSGGAGLVYKITLGDRPGEILAVKKICNSRKLDSKLEKEFEAEVEILGSIRHANIVKLLCCISSSDSKLLVYEYMENGSLDQWLHSRRRTEGPPLVRIGAGRSMTLDWPTRLAIAIGAAKGLCYMHHDCSPPIVHRDIKSSNILLDSEFNAKIADFGLARMLVKAGEPESVSTIAGSFGYMAPECGWLRKVNEKVDVFSFGVVLLELTTGREANHGDEDSCLSEWAWKHLHEGNSLVDAIDEETRDPAYLEEIQVVHRLGIICTGASPASRPSMKDVLQVLQRCNQSVGNDLVVKQSELGEYDAAPLIGTKLGSRRKRSVEVVGEEDDYGDDSYV